MTKSVIIVLFAIFINGVITDENWDNIELECPKQCVCQSAHFMDLSIARWINYAQSKQINKNDRKFKENDDQETLINDNEAVYDNDESYLSNPFIKQATCILQEETNPEELIANLPHDIQALIILYTGQGRNKTVATGIFKPLNQLTTLEIRGPIDRSFKLIVDEPLSFLNYANFESIQLFGSENSKRPQNPIHPRDSFDYVPSSENVDYNILLENNDEIEILPYDLYLMEVKKSRMATLYGWERLQVLRIHHCKLDELHWEMFDGLDELQHLSLEHNQIKIISPFALYGAMHIKTLSLAYNSILDLNYRALAGLLELETLDLSHNSITKLSELTFPPFPKLEYVDFRHNPIRYIFQATFGVMNNTRTMYLGSEEVNLELYANNPFEYLEYVKLLSIGNVTITTLDQNIFKGLRSIENLKIRGNIRRIEFDAFIDMTGVKEIDIAQCGIKDISMDAFIGCKNLELIDLSNNNLSYIPPGLFDDQTNLKEIYLNGNNLKYLPSTFFNGPSLKLVRLTDNPWRCTCEMIFWKSKITNQYRGVRQERCIHDIHGNLISCRLLSNYKFDNKLSPRCANVNGRSVYYALRKDLKCNIGKYFDRHMKNLNALGQRGSKFKQLEERRDRHQTKLEKKRLYVNRVSESQRANMIQKRINKIRKTLTEANSLEHMLSTNKEVPNNFILRNDQEDYEFNHI